MELSEKAQPSDRAELLRRLHHEPAILVLPNAWDVASAVALAAVPGVPGARDDERGEWRARSASRTRSRRRATRWSQAAARIAAAVSISGHRRPRGAATATRSERRGRRGRRVSSGSTSRTLPAAGLLPVEEQAALIRAIRAAVPELVLNARVDVFLRGAGDVDEAVERGNAYLAAGADCVYPILCPAGSIAELVAPDRRPDQRAAHTGRPAARRARRSSASRASPGARAGAGWPYAEAVQVARRRRWRRAVDDAGVAAARDVAEHPAHQHEQPVLEADQVDEVDAEPRRQAGKPLAAGP